MKKFIFTLVLTCFAICGFAQEPNIAPADILSYYKTASADEKRSIDSMFVDFEATKKAVQIKSICGVEFGMSRESALPILRNKFGSPMYNPNEMILSFQNIKYAGLDFESVYFLFQSDGRNSYLNSCIFVNGAKTKAEAEAIIESYRAALSRKYELTEIVGEIGFKAYGGGISPLWDGKWHTLLESLNKDSYLTAVLTDVIEYESNIVREFGNKYGVRIIYGPYEFVKEEF